MKDMSGLEIPQDVLPLCKAVSEHLRENLLLKLLLCFIGDKIKDNL